MLTLLALRLRGWLASRRRRDEMRELLGHGDRLLADAGVTRADIEARLGGRAERGPASMGLLNDICRYSPRALGLSALR